MKFCEPRNKRRKTIIGKCCRPELKGKLTSVANRLQPRSLCSQHSRRNVRLTEPILTWPLEGGALINSAMLGDADVLYFCSSFLSTLEDRVSQFCKGAQRWARFDFTGGFTSGVSRLESCVPLIDLFEQKVQGQPWSTCRTLISHLFSIHGGTSTTWEAFWGPVPASLPPAGCPAQWGGVRWVKPLLGKLPWEWGAPPTVAVGLFGAIDWRIQVLVPRMWWEQLRPWIVFFTSLLR